MTDSASYLRVVIYPSHTRSALHSSSFNLAVFTTCPPPPIVRGAPAALLLLRISWEAKAVAYLKPWFFHPCQSGPSGKAAGVPQPNEQAEEGGHAKKSKIIGAIAVLFQQNLNRSLLMCISLSTQYHYQLQ